MIGFIVFGVMSLVIGEIVFFISGEDEDDLLITQFKSLSFGLIASIFLWAFPRAFSNICLEYGEYYFKCERHIGVQAFLWYYGIIIGIASLFLLKKKLLEHQQK